MSFLSILPFSVRLSIVRVLLCRLIKIALKPQNVFPEVVGKEGCDGGNQDALSPQLPIVTYVGDTYQNKAKSEGEEGERVDESKFYEGIDETEHKGSNENKRISAVHACQPDGSGILPFKSLSLFIHWQLKHNTWYPSG